MTEEIKEKEICKDCGQVPGDHQKDIIIQMINELGGRIFAAIDGGNIYDDPAIQMFAIRRKYVVWTLRINIIRNW